MFFFLYIPIPLISVLALVLQVYCISKTISYQHLQLNQIKSIILHINSFISPTRNIVKILIKSIPFSLRKMKRYRKVILHHPVDAYGKVSFCILLDKKKLLIYIDLSEFIISPSIINYIVMAN